MEILEDWNISLTLDNGHKLDFYDISIVGFTPFSASFTKWLNRLKQFVLNLTTKLSVFSYFVVLARKGLNITNERLSILLCIPSARLGMKVW